MKPNELNAMIQRLHAEIKRLQKLKLPGYKRVKVGATYRAGALLALHDAVADLKTLKQHL